MDIYAEIEKTGPAKQQTAYTNPKGFTLSNYKMMASFRQRFGYAVPSREAIQEIATWSSGRKILELGAGRGLWAKLLQDFGADVEASDPNPPDCNFYFSQYGEKATPHTFTKIIKINGQDHAKSSRPSDVLMLVWPEYEDSTPEDWQQSALKTFKGSRLVFVGESQAGCTGSPSFWKEIKSNWKQLDKCVRIPTWIGIHDYVMFFSR